MSQTVTTKIRVISNPVAKIKASAANVHVHIDGITTYSDLPDKPSINGHELRDGENALEEIGITRCPFDRIVALFNNGGN